MRLMLAPMLSACIFFTNTVYAARVVPSGKTVGIKIYTDGLTVTGISEFTSEDGKSVCPAQDAGINAGDVIKSVNGSALDSCEELENMLTGDTINLEISRNGEALSISVTPVRADNGRCCIGAWVRDSTAGIGTITCYDPETLRYNALGHAVTDVDTGNIMTVRSGNIQRCVVCGVTKGGIGFPGSVSADFTADEIGTIDLNSETGITGVLNAEQGDAAAVETADIDEVYDGDVTVLTDVCGESVPYNARIRVISKSGTRNMVIEITDERLLEKTGGIVQGMSGAPVLQDGKLIGAITHVFVNNPAKGYCISCEGFLN